MLAELTISAARWPGRRSGFFGTTRIPRKCSAATWVRSRWGGAIGVVAVILKQEILLLSAGGIFILELLSVIIQVGSFKLTGKRVSHGPAAPPFRTQGLERIEDHRAVLILALACAVFC